MSSHSACAEGADCQDTLMRTIAIAETAAVRNIPRCLPRTICKVPARPTVTDIRVVVTTSRAAQWGHDR